MTTLPAAVLWDLDGTLIDTEPYWIAEEFELVRQFDGQWTDDDALSIVGFDLLDAAKVIRERGGVDLAPQEIVDRLVDGVIARIRAAAPWRPGARELLVALNQRGVPCALVTMSWKRITDEVLLHLPAGSFQTVVTGDMVLNGKPHPEPYRRAASELGVDPESCVAIEDSPTGVASAEGAGCVVVAVPNVVTVPPAHSRVMLNSLHGISPEDLGEFVETTPPPLRRSPDDDSDWGSEDGDDPDDSRRAAFPWPPWLPAPMHRLAALALVAVVAVAGVWWVALRDTTPPYEPGAFNVHVWAPYWTADQSISEISPRANVFHQVSPFWYQSIGVSSIIRNPQADADVTKKFIDEARGRGIPIVASIIDATESGVMASILADPAQRTTHVAAIRDFAAANEFDGIDIDYEQFAFADGRDTWAATRPNWVAFVEELGARLHADGRLLTVSIPPVYDTGQSDDSGYWVYDYGGIAPHVDAIRIMAYDYSTSSPGPIAPLDWVRTLIDGTIDAAGGPDKLVLGVPLYGRNWVLSTVGDCPTGTSDGTENVRLDSVDDLIARRNATPVYDEATGETTFTYQRTVSEGDASCTQTREVHYVDALGAAVRMQMSVDAGLLGVSLFALGYEDEQIWTEIAEINASLPTTVPATTA
ncbi:hypothetical protein BH24ACT5_BH24ACT5_05910 [soil metagenome]